MVQPDLTADLTFAHELADIAASVTLARFGNRLPVQLKDDATPVTEVDRIVERAIRDAVAVRFPLDAVLGEEQGLAPGISGRRWIVDPVDGTKLYAEGIPLWTTLIALEVDTCVVLGIADAPALGDRYVGVVGQGAWRGAHRLRVSSVARLDQAFIAHSGVEEWIGGGRADQLLEVTGRARRTRGLSDAWGHLLVAQGSVDALLEHEPCQPWDWSATQLIVQEAGGRLSTLDGLAPTPGSDLLVSNGVVHDEIVVALGSVERTFASDGGMR
jgi:histidinol-phosphatase